MLWEYGKASTWRRIGILVGVVALTILAVPLLQLTTDGFIETAPSYSAGFVEITGPLNFRLIDKNDDGRIDCGLYVPAWPWSKRGYVLDGIKSCRGRNIRPMPPEMATLANEALALRSEHRLSLARLLDNDDDGHVDCAIYDGTWRHADGASCSETLRSDARVFTEAEQRGADRLLAIETEIRARWLER
jgi:hypothetical protein